jgi:ABC-type transporter Mla MlaB component
MDDLAIEHSPQLLIINGVLTLHTVNRYNLKYIVNTLNDECLIINLANAEKIDTAGLAWLLSFVEQAQLSSTKLCFINLSDDLIKLATLSGVEDLFSSST